jgi:hypothetical protein
LVLTNGKTEFFAKNKKESELWQRIICRIVDINNGEKEPFRAGYSLAWETLQAMKHVEDEQNRVASKSRSSLKDTEYKSNNMDFSYKGVQGLLYKRIEDIKVYHTQGWHMKFFRINFLDTAIQIFESESAFKKKNAKCNVIWLQ